DADVGWIEVLIGGEGDAVAVLALIGEICEPADGQQVRGVEEREPILAAEPLAPLDLAADRD
ncbi:MAG TPA: hypothetical protein VNG35_07150, partial [Gemmatimonadales bacterium]|nr:hypothetical protein [Gemmatimonadales bacterium]